MGNGQEFHVQARQAGGQWERVGVGSLATLDEALQEQRSWDQSVRMFAANMWPPPTVELRAEMESAESRIVVRTVGEWVPLEDQGAGGPPSVESMVERFKDLIEDMVNAGADPDAITDAFAYLFPTTR